MRHASRRASQSLGQAADRVRHVALLLSNAAVFTKEPSGFVFVDRQETGLVWGVCVTGSVAVGTQRDSQDTTGQTSIVELSGVACGLYGEIRGFGAEPDPFFKSITTLVRKTTAFGVPRIAASPMIARSLKLAILDWTKPLSQGPCAGTAIGKPFATCR